MLITVNNPTNLVFPKMYTIALLTSTQVYISTKALTVKLFCDILECQHAVI